MKLNAGIITEKLAETKAFYTEILGFGAIFLIVEKIVICPKK